MALLTRTLLKDFNSDRLREEVETAGLPSLSFSMRGFEQIGARLYTPAAVRRRVGYSSSTGDDFADPGELHIAPPRDLTVPETVTLDATLTAHNAALLSTEQARQDQDETDVATLLATERQTYIDDIQALNAIVAAWDGQNSAQRQVATKDAIARTARDFTIIGKALRLVLRQRGAGI